MNAQSILNVAVGFLIVWIIAVAGFALVRATRPVFDPGPAELPEHHDDDHGHAAPAAHGH